MCANSSKAKCIARNSFAYNVKDIWPSVKRWDPNDTGAYVFIGPSFVSVYSSIKRTYPAACSLASHLMTSCLSGSGSFSESFAAFARFSLISKMVSLCCWVN